MPSRTIFLTVQTGIAARDLIVCGVLDRILQQPEARVVILSPGYRDPAFLAMVEHERVTVVPLQSYAPSTMKWRLMTRRWRYAKNPAQADLIHRAEEMLLNRNDYDALFEQFPPDLVVSGDPLRPGDSNLVAAAHRHGVPSLGSVRSWDNLIKHLRTRADQVTVWNDINAREAVETERYRPRDVRAVGSPQMDPYFQTEGVQDREVFFAQEGLDPNKKLLLLATSSFTYESDQTYLVDMLLEAIRSGEIHHDVQIMLRLHPADSMGRYIRYGKEPEVTLDLPDRFLPTLGWTANLGDIQRMANLLRHTDVMLNFATTVTLEAAIFDTPTLLVAFSTIDPEVMEWYVVKQHFGMHFKGLVDRDLVPVAWNREDLIRWVNGYLDDPTQYRRQRQEIVRDWVQFTDGRSAERMGDTILRAAGLQPPPPGPPAAAWPSGGRAFSLSGRA